MNAQDFFQLEQLTGLYGPVDVLLNISLAFALSMVVSFVYKTTHRGLSYSQSFMLTIVFVAVVVSMVMMVIGNNLARAFALVGALSIIRFRTVVKDTKDTAYIFMALAAGMASGTSTYFLAIVGTSLMCVIAIILHKTNYGSLYKSEFVLRMRVMRADTEHPYNGILKDYTQSASILNVEPSGDGESNKLTFDIVMRDGRDPTKMANEISALDSVSELVLVASKSDVDY